MTHILSFRSKLFIAAIASMFLFSSCDKENNDENIVIKQAELKRQVQFLDKNEPAVTSDWGPINQEGTLVNLGVFVADPSKIYLGATYPESDILTGTFKHEIAHKKRPFHLYCTGRHSYVDSTSTINNIQTYQAAYQKLINSNHLIAEDAENWSSSSKREEGSFKTYEGLKTNFYGQSDLGKQFIRTAYQNAKGLKKVKGRISLHKLSVLYSIYMDHPQALFKEDVYNHPESYTQDNLPLYAKHIVYGKAVWVIIESEYPWDELYEAINYIRQNDVKEIESNRYIKNIVDKTVFTVLSLGNSEGVFCAPVSIEEFKNQYTKSQKLDKTYGSPLFVRWRYVHDGGSMSKNI